MGRGAACCSLTSLKLLRHCPCPVWITKPSQEGANRRRDVLNVLVASDFATSPLMLCRWG
jgi:hypothetical protein